MAAASGNVISLIDVETNYIQHLLEVQPNYTTTSRVFFSYTSELASRLKRSEMFCLSFNFFRDTLKMSALSVGIRVGNTSALSVKTVHVYGRLILVENAYMNCIRLAINSSRAHFILGIHCSWFLVAIRY